MGVTLTPDTFANFAVSTLAGGAGGVGTSLGATDTTLHVASGTGALFPTAYPFRLTINPNALAAAEIVLVTGSSGTDAFTIVRHQEGTASPSSWALGTTLAHGDTAANWANLWSALSSINLTNGGTISGALALPGGSSVDASGDITSAELSLQPVGSDTAASGNARILNFTTGPALVIKTQQSGAAQGVAFGIWNGTSNVVPFSIGGQLYGASAYVDTSGDFITTGNVQATGTLTAFNGLHVKSTEGGTHDWLLFERTSGLGQQYALSLFDATASVTAWTIDNSGNMTLGGALATSHTNTFAAPTSSNDALYLQNGNDHTWQMNVGVSTSGYQVWDNKNSGFVFSGGTSSGLTIGGSLTVNSTLTVSGSHITGGSGALVLQAGGSTGNAAIGFKNSSGSRIFEIATNGNPIAGASIYQGASGAPVLSGSGSSFDAFDYGEAYPMAEAVPLGVLVCAGEDGRMHRCTHEGCHAALVTSNPGYSLGYMHGDELINDDDEKLIKPCALVGRVQVRTRETTLPVRTLMTSDGTGGVRAMQPGEAGFSLGSVLGAPQDGYVLLLLRPLYCVAPAVPAPSR